MTIPSPYQPLVFPGHFAYLLSPHLRYGQFCQKPTPQQQANLIRPEQVAKLPQLSPPQKQQYQQAVTRFWEILNVTPPTDPQYQDAYKKLHTTSQQLMAGMKQWQVRKQMQQQQVQQQAQQAQQQAQQQATAQAQAQTQPHASVQAQAPRPGGQPGQGQALAAAAQGGQNPGSALQFSQLLPDIQRKVNENQFFYPPAMTKGTEPAEIWLREAKARLGQALQRLHIAKQKKGEFQRQAQGRQAAGNPLNQEETGVFNGKIAQCDRAINESTSFMKKFTEQQDQFKNAQPQHQFSKQAVSAGEGPETAAAPHMQSGGVQGPTAHSISSAVSAARNQASAAQAGSPTAPAPMANQSAVAISQQTPVSATQAHFPAVSQGDISAGPRPVSHQGLGMPPLQQHNSSSSIHPHPLNTSINGVKTPTPHITKNLQLPDPKPVQMPPSRPTLTGGAGVGLPGQLGQPAIVALPGYVLESSEDGRVLSKKKLNELVREICGPGPEEQLDPEAEEVSRNRL